jgi:hypothetical protein
MAYTFSTVSNEVRIYLWFRIEVKNGIKIVYILFIRYRLTPALGSLTQIFWLNIAHCNIF